MSRPVPPYVIPSDLQRVLLAAELERILAEAEE